MIQIPSRYRNRFQVGCFRFRFVTEKGNNYEIYGRIAKKDSGYPKNQNSLCFQIIKFTSTGTGLSEKLYRDLSVIKLPRVLADNVMRVFIRKTTH